MSQSPSQHGKRHHAVIAGTGRAGTTFLVQFLTACGVDAGGASELDDRANAGLEIPLHAPDAPYLTKDPWLYTYCDSLNMDELAVDVVILPVRDLRDAVTSRLIQEKSRVIEGMPDHFAFADAYGVVPGGSIYSLEPLDLERILATGFYRVVQWALRNDLPVVLLDFPRLVNDGSYLIDGLWPWLSSFCSRETAMKAFASTAQSEKVTAGAPRDSLLTDADFRAMQIVVRDAQRQATEARESNRDLRLQLERARLEKTAMENSRLWRLTRRVGKLLGR